MSVNPFDNNTNDKQEIKQLEADYSSCNQETIKQLSDQNLLQPSKDNYSEIVNYMRLIRSTNIGTSLFWRLIDIFGDASTAVYEAEEFFKKINSKKKIKLATIAEVEEEIEKTLKFGAEIIIASDIRYPQLLRTIFDPPAVLTAKGDLSFFNKPSVAIIGARNCSFAGGNIAKRIAVELGENSIITVSGLAKGIDSAVHEASILSGTIAVIAGGIDSVYPQENKRLYQQIAQYGLLVSEMKFGTPPKSNYFIKRNRIISGLSPNLIVVEAGLKSGSLATAKFALEQGREIYACAGSPFDPRCAGVNKLIKDGARIITDLNELIIEIEKNNRNMFAINFEEINKNSSNLALENFTKPPKENFINNQNESQGIAKNIIQSSQIDDDEIKKIVEIIISKINNQAISIDEIIEHLQKPARLVNVALMQLELNGQIAINHGKVSGDNLLI